VFTFFKKASRDVADFSGIACDMHSHLIPGIDDGAKDMEDSLHLIRGLADLGYRKLITTPHVLVDYYPNTPTTIGDGFRAVQTELKKENIAVEFRAAAEYLMDDHFISLLETDQPLLTLKDKMVLVELSFAVPAINLKEILFQMQLRGYQPVLAHPERCKEHFTPERWEGFRQTQLAKGHDIGGPRLPPTPSPYLRRINAQDPLDELYWELDQFLDQDGQRRLRKCPQCGRYFVQRTARVQTYCSTPCRRKANPTERTQNATYQRRHRAIRREKQIKADLKRVGEIKQAFMTEMSESPMAEDVLERLHIGRRRWNRLVNWEIAQYGHPRDTDLKAEASKESCGGSS